jgi:hypothetical protein
LSQIYAAQRAFHSEWNQYFGDFRNLALELNGELYYRMGFESGTTSAPTNYVGPGLPETSASAQHNTDPALGYCAVAAGLGFPCYEISSRICSVAGRAPTCVWGDQTFNACGCGIMRNNAGDMVEDVWMINEQKQFTHQEI